MDWITGIQRALDYAEEHMAEEIVYETAAKQAYSSSFHFQRIFAMLCGYSFGDYIRMRRLTLAAEDLQRSKEKIADIAFRYGYDSPESFTRAFTRFHGVAPSAARRGGSVKSFSRLSVKLILSGGNTMDYRIEKKQAFQLVCKKKYVNKPQGDTATADISAFWNECTNDGTMQKLCKYARFDNLNGVLGVCFSKDMADSGFPYAIGAHYNGAPVPDPGLTVESRWKSSGSPRKRTRFSSAGARCPTRLKRRICKFARNFSRRAITNTAAASNSKCTLRTTWTIPNIIARSGSP